MSILLGFDPGGSGNFGWCVAIDSQQFPTSAVASGLSNDGSSAVQDALSAVPSGEKVAAVGIDAPLYWPISGSRDADLSVRAAIKTAGAPHAAGTVQDVNSLRGACLIQGMLAAIALRERFPSIPITEAHPKALRWLLPEVARLCGSSEHERDALLSAVAAWGTVHQPEGWQDLILAEAAFYSPVAAPLHYFMPGVPN